MTATPWSRVKILREVGDERQNQIRKWGLQQHPFVSQATADLARIFAEAQQKRNDANPNPTWDDILQEEQLESYAEFDLARKRAEAVQVAAVAVAMIEAIDAGGEPV